MKIVQTKGKISEGELKIKVDQNFRDGEIDVVIIAKNEPDDCEKKHQFFKKRRYRGLFERKIRLIRLFYFL